MVVVRYCTESIRRVPAVLRSCDTISCTEGQISGTLEVVDEDELIPNRDCLKVDSLKNRRQDLLINSFFPRYCIYLVFLLLRVES